MTKKNGFTVWDSDLEKELFSEEEIAASNSRVERSVAEPSGGKITICGEPGSQVRNIIKALRSLADSLEPFLLPEEGNGFSPPSNWCGEIPIE